MKKAVKITIFIAIGMVIIGTAMAFVSMAACGFNMKNLMETEKYEVKSYVLDDDFDDIVINVDSDSFAIYKSEDEKTHVEVFESEKMKYDVSVNNKVLNIESQQLEDGFDFSKMHFVVDFRQEPCKVFLPKEEYESLRTKIESGSFTSGQPFTFHDAQIELGSGSLRIDSMKAEELTGTSKSGSIDVFNITANNATLEAGSGSVKLEEAGIDGTLKLKSTSGSVKVIKTECKNADIRTGSGSLLLDHVKCAENLEASVSSGSIKMEEVVAGGNLKAKTGSGSISFTSCDAKDLDLQTSSGSVHGTLKTGKMFNAKANSGSVNVPDDDANGGVCRIHTGSGSIKVTLVGSEDGSDPSIDEDFDDEFEEALEEEIEAAMEEASDVE